jgi:hypothetical protein
LNPQPHKLLTCSWNYNHCCIIILPSCFALALISIWRNSEKIIIV